MLAGGGELVPGHQVRLEEGSRSARKSSSFTALTPSPSPSPSPAAKSLSKWPSKSATVASTFSTVIALLPERFPFPNLGGGLADGDGIGEEDSQTLY
jgi:hypothetical protein